MNRPMSTEEILDNRNWRPLGLALVALAGSLVLGGESLATASTVRSQSFPYQPGDTIIVQNDYGRVRIRPGTSREVQAQIRLIAQDERGLANIAVVAQKSGSKIFVNTYFYDYRAESAYIEILAPESVNVVVWGANPAVDVSDLTGYVRVYTQTGLITAANLTASSSLTADTGDILLRLAKQPFGDIRLESTTGKIRCELLPGLNVRGWTRAGTFLSWNREVEFQGGQLERQVGVGGPLLLAVSLQGSVQVDLNLSDRVSVPSAPPRPPDSRQTTYPGPDSTSSSGDRPQERDYPPDRTPYPTEEPSRPTTTSGSEGGGSGGDVDYRTNPDGTIDSGYSLKVNVNWTYLNVSVRDRYNNRSIPSLRQSDFQLYEDGVEQQIEKFESAEAPFSLLLLLDVSGSTKSFIDLIQEASIEFTRQIKPNDSMALAVFNSDVRLAQPFTNDRSQMERAIRRIRSGGGTAFYDALDTSIRDYMAGQEGRKAIVVFTDGVDNQLTGDYSNGSRTTFRELYRDIQEIDTIIYTIFLDTENSVPGQRRRRGSIIDILGDITRGGGVGGGGGGPVPSGDQAYDEARRELRIIADQTGGRMYSPNDIYDLNNVYAEIAADLRVQYTLGYNSTNSDNDGKWRAIEVRVRNIPDAEVRARKGYYAPGGSADSSSRRNRLSTP